MKILDATAGLKGIWYQKNHPFVTFMDKRYEKKTIKIKPKILKIAKIQAIEDDITLSKLISIALKEYLGTDDKNVT